MVENKEKFQDDKEFFRTEDGKCPVCQGTNLDYGSLIPIGGELVYWPFTCEDCGVSGEELWKLTDGNTEVPKSEVDLSESEIQELREKTEEQERL